MTAIAAGEIEQVIEEMAHAHGLFLCRHQPAPLIVAEIVAPFQSAMQVPLHDGEWSAQFVADGAHELALIRPRLRQAAAQLAVGAGQLSDFQWGLIDLQS